MAPPRLGTAILAALSAAPALAQTAPPPSVRIACPGSIAATGGPSSFVVEQPGAVWLRLHFASVDLPQGARLRIVSALDGGEQVLDARTAAEWQETSAYFNGDALLVEVLAGAGRTGGGVELADAEVGLVPPGTGFSQCGPTDDRQPSSDPRVARLLPEGCTAWIVEGCGHCLVTAGHCAGGLLVAEFEVPPSLPNGAIVHPPPEHQYVYDPLSLQSENAGVGKDWAVFGCFPNPVTGRTPYESALAAFVAVPATTAEGNGNVRLAGYGVDYSPPEANQVQQADQGALLDASGPELAYLADSQAGNSGGAIEWVEGGVAIGVHTHGGCDAGRTQGNRGTPIDHPPLAHALANPRGVCAGEPASSATAYCVAKTNSLGCAPRIVAGGAASAGGGAGSFTISAEDVITHQPGLLLYGPAPAAVPFAGGMRCVANPLVRVGLQDSGGAPGVEDCSGAYAYDMGARIASGVDPLLVAGTTVYAQWWMRDAGSWPDPVGLTGGLAFTIGP